MGFGVKKIRGDVSGNSQAIVMGGMERELVGAGLLRLLDRSGWDPGRMLGACPGWVDPGWR